MENKDSDNTKLGFWGLVAIVLGMVVGSGIYNVPQNMAATAGVGAVAVAWVVTALCILSLVATFKTLADRRPDLKAGIYEYAREGFGRYTGFNMAWGYWLSACVANIAYVAMLNDSFGVFFPVLMDHGVATLVFGTVLIWLMSVLVLAGIRTAKFVNMAMAVLKVVAVAFVIVLLYIHLNLQRLGSDVWGVTAGLGDLTRQVRGTMMVTLFCFIGIEGAVMMAARARNPRHVGRSGLVGFGVAWLLYVLVSVLSFGVMSQAGLSRLDDPSAAYVLRAAAGDWAYYFVIVSVIVSLLGGFLAWCLVCSQCAMEAAEVGVFPRRFLRLNRNSMPSYAIMASAVMMEMFLLVVILSDDIYLSAVGITGMMVLPPYLFSGLYLCKLVFGHQGVGDVDRVRLLRFRVAGVVCVLSCLWMIWAGGLDLLLETALFYLPGVVFYMMACNGRRFWGRGALRKAFSPAEMVQLGLVVAGAAASLCMLL